MRIVDVTGRTRLSIESVSDDANIDLSSLESGTYLAVINESQGAIHSSMFIRR
ncbi:MAG: T9SS type A sorting domain-containing protein [Candidatus Kapaibacterium sp.]